MVKYTQKEWESFTPKKDWESFKEFWEDYKKGWVKILAIKKKDKTKKVI